MVEVIITSLKDGYGNIIDKYVKRHELLVFLVCAVSLLFGLPHMFQGGIYFFTLIDYYAAAISLMYIALFETITIVWIYGTKRLSANIEEMTGKKPHKIFQFCWACVSPLLIIVLWVFSLLDYSPPSYGGYTNPDWSIALGWFITSLSVLPIPVLAIIIVARTKGTNIVQKFQNSFVSKMSTEPCCDTVLSSNNQAHAKVGDKL